MKKLIIFIIFIFTFTSAWTEEKMRVGIIEFEVKGNVDIKDAGIIIAEWLNSSIMKTDKYTIVERVFLKKVLEEQELSVSDITDKSTMNKIGKIYGVDALVTGTVIEWQKIISLSIRLIDVSTGQVLSTAEIKTADSKSIPFKMDTAAKVLAGLVPQEVLENEILAVINQTGNQQTPISLIKIAYKNGRLEGIINKGFNDKILIKDGWFLRTIKISKGDFYLIYVPTYNISQITGLKTMAGKEVAGTLEITYVENNMSLGIVILNSKYKPDAEILTEQGIALPFSPMFVIGAGSLNTGALLEWGIYLTPNIALTFLKAGFIFYGFDFLTSGISLGWNLDLYFLGNITTDFRLCLGVAVIANINKSSPSDPSFTASNIDFYAGVGPYLGIELMGLFLRAGGTAGLAVGIQSSFYYQPYLQLGFKYAFNLDQID